MPSGAAGGEQRAKVGDHRTPAAVQLGQADGDRFAGRGAGRRQVEAGRDAPDVRRACGSGRGRPRGPQPAGAVHVAPAAAAVLPVRPGTPDGAGAVAGRRGPASQVGPGQVRGRNRRGCGRPSGPAGYRHCPVRFRRFDRDDQPLEDRIGRRRRRLGHRTVVEHRQGPVQEQRAPGQPGVVAERAQGRVADAAGRSAGQPAAVGGPGGCGGCTGKGQTGHARPQRVVGPSTLGPPGHQPRDRGADASGAAGRPGTGGHSDRVRQVRYLFFSPFTDNRRWLVLAFFYRDSAPVKTIWLGSMGRCSVRLQCEFVGL